MGKKAGGVSLSLASLLVVGGVVLVSTYFSRFQRFSIPRCSQ